VNDGICIAGRDTGRGDPVEEGTLPGGSVSAWGWQVDLALPILGAKAV